MKEKELERGRTRTRTRPPPVTPHDMGMFGVGFCGAWAAPPTPAPPNPTIPTPTPLTPSLRPPPLPPFSHPAPRPASSVYSQDNGEDSTATSTKDSSLSGNQENSLPNVQLLGFQAATAASSLPLVARPRPPLPRLSPSSRIPVLMQSTPSQPPASKNRWEYGNTNPGTAERRYLQRQMADDFRVAHSYQQPASRNDEGLFINVRQNALYVAIFLQVVAFSPFSATSFAARWLTVS